MRALPLSKFFTGLIMVTVIIGFAITGCTKERSETDAITTSLSVNQLALMDYTLNEEMLKTSSENILTMPQEELSAMEEEAIMHMREEEFLAHDVYLYLSQLYTKPVFRNIKASEMVHASAVRTLIVKYNLVDPAAGHVTGVFTNSDLQVLYNNLTTLGATSLLNGLTVSATIEDLDIYDIQQYQMVVDNRDIMLVLNHLKNGSKNHMRAFYANIVFLGGTYVPQYITQEEFNAIIGG